MKTAFFLFIAFTLPMLVYSQATESAPEMPSPAGFETGSAALTESDATLPFKGVFQIRDALTRAEGYLREKNVDLSGQYLHSVQLYYDEGIKRKGYYWLVQWTGSADGEETGFTLRIYMDGAVIPGTTES